MRPVVQPSALAGLLRAAFAATTLAACTADLWLLGGPLSGRTPTIVGALLVVVGAGIGLAARPAWAPAFGLVAATGSLVVTVAIRVTALRFGALVDLVVLPMLLGFLLQTTRRGARPAAALVALAAAVLPLRSDVAEVSASLALAVVIGLATATGAVLYQRLLERERQSALRLARQEDRLELARELHDLVGHHVTGIIVTAQAERVGLPDDDPRAEPWVEIERAGAETMRSIRHLVGLLRSDRTTSTPTGTPDAVPDVLDVLVADLRRSHPEVELDVAPELHRAGIPDALGQTVVRVVREAATNVRRHGDPAHTVTIRLDRRLDAIIVTVTNRPSTRPSDQTSGFGLVGLRERVEAMGGTLAAGLDGERWRLEAVLPITATPR